MISVLIEGFVNRFEYAKNGRVLSSTKIEINIVMKLAYFLLNMNLLRRLGYLKNLDSRKKNESTLGKDSIY